MTDTHLVVVSGSRGAGKDSIATALAVQLHLRRIVAYTTRAPRHGEQDGREYHFVSDSEFEKLVRDNRFVWFGQVSPAQRHGVSEDVFKTSSGGSVLVTMPPAALAIRKRMGATEGGMTFLLAVFASRAERYQRIRKRQPDISDLAVQRLMQEDPVSPRIGDFRDFDARILNSGTNPKPAYQRAIKLVRRFLQR